MDKQPDRYTMATKITKSTEVMMAEIQRIISEGNTVSITARGYSMNPFIRHNRDQVTLGPWKDIQIRKGAVILARTVNGQYVLHRIIKREGNVLTLEGDGNIGTQETATTENLIGLLHSIARNGKTCSTESCIWKTYSRLWMFFRPLRRYPLALWRKLNPQEPLH